MNKELTSAAPPQVAFQLISNRAVQPSTGVHDPFFRLFSAYDYVIPAYGGRAMILFDLRLRAPHGHYIRLASRLGLALYNGIVVHSGMHVANAMCEPYTPPDLLEIPRFAKIHVGGAPTCEQGFHNFLMRTDFAAGKNPIPKGENGDWGSSWYEPPYSHNNQWRSVHARIGSATFHLPSPPIKQPETYGGNTMPQRPPPPPPVYQQFDKPLDDWRSYDKDDSNAIGF